MNSQIMLYDLPRFWAALYAALVVSMLVMLVVTTPSEASESCMSKTEARQHFGSVYIYWHGQDHCWDATPTRRHHRIQNVQRNRQVHEVKRKIDQPKWHDSMSEMLPDDQPVRTTVQAPWVDRWVDFEPPQLPIAARWVDIVQVKSPPVIERKPEPVISPRTVMLVFIAIALALALTLATIKLLFRGMIHE
jgi:hypothetical protein